MGFGAPLRAGETPEAAAASAPPLDEPRAYTPEHLAKRILAWSRGSQVHRLRRRVRQNYTWQAIFSRDIEPLLPRTGGSSA